MSPEPDRNDERPNQATQQFRSGNILYHGQSFDDSKNSSNYSIRSLVRPPIVRQWIHQGNMHREETERVPSRLELFFDLVFVAIANQMSHSIADSASGVGIIKFILIFYPTWSLWSEFRNFINASGTDDILQRVAVLWLMALLIGYTANASAIRLGSPESAKAASEPVAVIARAILAEASPSAGTEAPLDPYARDPALVATVAFFLVAKISRVVVLIWYALALPLFRSYFFLQVVYQMSNFLVYFPLLFVRSPGAIITLATLGMVSDYFFRYLFRAPIVVMHRLTERMSARGQHRDLEMSNSGMNAALSSRAHERRMQKRRMHIPAVNVEHFVERTAAFVVIVLGEIVLSVVYNASESQIGLGSVYGTALSALLVAFNFCWLYFDAECSHEFVHAMNRHWFTSVTFTNLHFPLCASLIIVASATYKMTQHPSKVTPAIRWYFSGGLGVALVTLALIGATHRGLDPTGTTRLGRYTQLGWRIAVGVIIFCLPLTSDVTALFMLANSAGLTTFLVVEETYGKLRRGEPLAKPSAAEQDMMDARAHAAEVDITRINSSETMSMDSVSLGIPEARTR
ncbi:hypothetical protein BDV93DRAFT_526376 [Ceratobasidium sp. AG-I]|nr:hypothetical protein BDV93DRAFT_526376 [Ceratobasidium sp. AG-I]